VAFSQVREDADIDLSISHCLGTGLRGVMIASGGCTAAALAVSGRFDRLDVVDLNESQLALTRLKFWLAFTAQPLVRLRVLGHLPLRPVIRNTLLSRAFSQLALHDNCLGELDYVSRVG